MPPVEDYLAICEVKARYCRCLDTKDWAGYADQFTEDAVLDTRDSGGPLVEGREALVAMVRGSMDDAITAHQVHSPELSVSDEDMVEAIFAMQDRVIFSQDRAAQMGIAGLTGFGHYRETYRRCEDGVWRIASSKLTRLHIDRMPLQA